jgi:uncharacterized protein YjbI with pentapeptide repeats
MEQTTLKILSESDVRKQLKAQLAYRRGIPGGARARFDYCDLSGMKLLGVDLVDADFTGAKLDRVDFTGSALSGACFFGADLRCAKLIRCDMRRANLRGALVHGADLSDSDLTNADLREGVIARKTDQGELVTVSHDALVVNASDASFRGSNMNGARMGGTICVAADFSYANMKNVKLVRAHLKQAILIGCDLSGADMSGANLEGADMRGAIMIGTNTMMMNTRGADMSDVMAAPPSQDPAEGARIRAMLESHVQWHKTGGEQGEPGQFDGLDMRDCQLFAGKSLAGLRARDAIFFGLNMTDCQLQGALLAGADLRGVDLSGADLRGANLKGAKLQRARLVGCDLSPLIVSGDKQFPCDLSGANLSAADLSDTDMRDARLDGALFTSANLTNTRVNRSQIAA